MSDAINPKHYTQHPSGIQCIEIVQHHNFNIGNAIKYLWRLGLKDGNSEIQELEKAKRYIEFEIARVSKQRTADAIYRLAAAFPVKRTGI